MWTTGGCGGDRRGCSQSGKEEFELESGRSGWGQSFLVQNLFSLLSVLATALQEPLNEGDVPEWMVKGMVKLC